MRIAITKKSRFVALLAATALTAGVVVAVPTAAQAADPKCQVASYVKTCVGATSDGAPYTFVSAANFNGTVFIWSHGIRPNLPLSPLLPAPLGGYKVTNTAEPAPGAADGDLTILQTLVAQGYGVAGSGFARQGVNVAQAVAANVELIGAFKKENPTTKKVIAWGQSLGSLITQKLAETHPELVDAAVLGCPATAPSAAIASYFGDFLWGFKSLFNTNIKGFGYTTTDPVKYATEVNTDLGLFFLTLKDLSDNLLTGKWPATSSAAGKALEAAGVPSRAALILIGLMAGVPMRSTHVDGTSGPTGQEEAYPLAIAPAVAVLENAGTVGAAAIMLMSDGELQTNGIVFDNTKTDYAARVDADKDAYSFALAGYTAVDKILEALNASPKVTASAAAVAKMQELIGITGKLTKPTVVMTTESDQYTVAGAGQWMIDQYTAQRIADIKAAAKVRPFVSPKHLLMPLWVKTASSYSKFTAAGSPDLTATPGAGTGHCLYTSAQWLFVAKQAVASLATGSFEKMGRVVPSAAKVGLSYDPKFSVPRFKALS